MHARTLVFACFRLLAEKSRELGEQVNKLCNGLLKISDTREKVEGMTVELEEAKKQVAEFQKQCEDYLTVILEQKREADRHQKVQLRKNAYFKSTAISAGILESSTKGSCIFLLSPSLYSGG